MIAKGLVDRCSAEVLHASLSQPGWILLLWATLLAVMAPGLGRLQVEASGDSALDRGDPA